MTVEDWTKPIEPNNYEHHGLTLEFLRFLNFGTRGKTALVIATDRDGNQWAEFHSPDTDAIRNVPRRVP
jgi:hypothetical protein